MELTTPPQDLLPKTTTDQTEFIKIKEHDIENSVTQKKVVDPDILDRDHNSDGNCQEDGTPDAI